MTQFARAYPATRRGYALMAVLWVVTAMSVLALATAVEAHDAVRAARNRQRLLRGAWDAEGCLVAALARLEREPHAWDSLHVIVARAAPLGCVVRATAVGSAVDVNVADGAGVMRLLRHAGMSAARSDSLAAALLDWRDADDMPRPMGAEREWYAARDRLLPRNGPLADVRELALIRGFDSVLVNSGFLSAEPGRISMNHAPMPVLASLPGVTPEVLGAIARRRDAGQWTLEWAHLARAVSAEARDSLGRNMTALVARATWSPDAWLLTAVAPADGVLPVATVEFRLGAAGGRLAIVRRREF